SWARVCPLWTVSPTWTSTASTVPDVGNDGVSFNDDVTVPDDSTVCVTEPSPTVASRRAGPLSLVAAMPAALPPPRTATPTAAATARRRRVRRRRARARSATVAPPSECQRALAVDRVGDPHAGGGDCAGRVGLALGGHALADLERGRRR